MPRDSAGRFTSPRGRESVLTGPVRSAETVGLGRESVVVRRRLREPVREHRVGDRLTRAEILERLLVPLHALAENVQGSNSVFAYGAAGSYPSDTFGYSNYWIDVIFNTTSSDTTPPTIASSPTSTRFSGPAAT